MAAPATPPLPTDAVEVSNGLSLAPRIRLLLTVHRADNSVAPLDEWKLKRSLLDFFKISFSHPIAVPEEDLSVRRFKNIKKRKREDPVAQGSIFVRDPGFVKDSAKFKIVSSGGDGDVVRDLEEKLSDWRKLMVEKMDGMEVNLEGVKFRLTVSSPVSDNFELMKKDWEEHFAFGNARGFSRIAKHEPDTLILRGLPSRWFAEPRVSSKPSMLVTHTIFSTLGKIRNLSVAEDDDPGDDADEDGGDIVPGLHCKIVVQFENYNDLCKALKIFCGRSLLKEGTRLKADYELTWDKDGYFRSGRQFTQEKGNRVASYGQNKFETPRRQPFNSRYGPDHARTKRFKD